LSYTSGIIEKKYICERTVSKFVIPKKHNPPDFGLGGLDNWSLCGTRYIMTPERDATVIAAIFAMATMRLLAMMWRGKNILTSKNICAVGLDKQKPKTIQKK